MKMRHGMSLRQGNRLALTVGLRRSMEFLRMSADDLATALDEAAADNPCLAVTRPGPAPQDWQPRWQSAFGGGGGGGDLADAVSAAEPSLIAHALAFIDTTFRDPGDRRIAIAFAETLEPSGWLGRPPADVAADLGVPAEAADRVLARLQEIEPTGLFARSLADCLRLQLREAGQLDPVMDCVLDNLGRLASGDLAGLAALCGVGAEVIADRLRLIRRLDPKPGAQFEPGAVVAEPDLLARPGPDGWVVEVNRSALPAVTVRDAPGADAGARAAADALRRVVEFRNLTLLRVARAILSRQEAALSQGLTALAPLTLAEIGAAVELHESTVSRIVAGASVATPRATWPLRAFFSTAIGDRSAGAARATLARLIAAEPRDAPLSDAALTDRMVAAGFPVARRTVAKYREALGLPGAAARRRRAAGGLTRR